MDAAAAGDVAETIAAFQRADRRGFIGRHWRKLLGLAAFVLACWMSVEAFRIRQAAQFIRSISSLSLFPSKPKRPAHLAPPQLLLLYGNGTSSNQEQRLFTTRSSAIGSNRTASSKRPPEAGITFAAQFPLT